MKKLQFYFALWAAKAVRILLILLGRNATYFPGEVAIHLCRDFLAYLKTPETVIAVTGTNGKTTVSNLITSILTECGYSVTNNSFGSNVCAGVTAALIQDTKLSGKPKKDIAVLEVDERSSLLVYPHIKPDFLICNNIMRDSIKRNAHTEFISFIINSALPENTKLVLNGDDIICSTLAPQCKNRTYFGVEAQKPDSFREPFINDMVYCPECGEKLEADYLRYNHIGRCHCTACEFKSPERDFVVTAIDREKGIFNISHNGEESAYKLVNDNIVNIYNFCGVVALLRSFGLQNDKIKEAFNNLQIVKSRFETVKAGNLNITKIMAKGQNPIACARCYDYVAASPEKDKSVIIIVDDHEDNINNSESTCWLYDCDYSYLASPSICEIVFCGPRCRDQYLRALLAGVAPEKIKCTESASEAAELADTEHFHDIFLLHELYQVKDAEICMQALIRKGEAV